MIALLLLLGGSRLLAASGDPEREPLPRYLEAAELAAALEARSPAIEACGAGQADGAWPIRLELPGTGVLRLVEGPLPAEVADCVQGRLLALPLPAHDEDPLQLQSTLVARGGFLRFGPVLELEARALGPFLLYLPLDLDPAAVGRIEAVLGLGTPGPAPAPALAPAEARPEETLPVPTEAAPQ